MKITYIAPPPEAGKRAAERVAGCAHVIYNVPNIYVLWVAAVLEKDGHQVRHVDAALENWSPERFREFIKADDSDAYYFYSVNLAKELDIATTRMIHEVRGGVPVIFTGPSPSDKVDDFVVDAHTFVVRGEAEVTTRELVRALRDKTPLAGVDGMSWRDGSGPVQHNKPRALIENLDEIPFPARHLIDREAYFNPKLGVRPFTSVMTSRGCPNQCIYCVPSSVTFAAELENKRYFGCKPRVRVRSIDNIVAEFEQLAREGYKGISIQDDQFAWGTERTVELCRRLAPLGLAWGCSCRADRLNEAIIKAMAAAGCKYIDIGVESFDPKVLRYIKKGYDDPKMVERVIKLIQKHGVKAKINILFGASPLETKTTIKRTIQEVRRIGPDQVMYDIVNPFPGTELYNLAKKEGWFRYGDYVPADVGKHSIIQLPHLKPRDLERAIRYANITFFFSPRFLFKNIVALRSLTALKNSLVAMYRKLV